MKILTTLVLILISISLFGQSPKSDKKAIPESEPENIIKIAPWGLVNKFRVQYEHKLTKDFSTGGVFSLYYKSTKAILLEPFFRIYFSGENPSGIYFQSGVVLGRVSSLTDYYFLIPEKVPVSIYTIGGNCNFGYQFVFGTKKNITADFSLGFQFLRYRKSATTVITKGEDLVEDMGPTFFNSTGPGAVFIPRLSLGFAF